MSGVGFHAVLFVQEVWVWLPPRAAVNSNRKHLTPHPPTPEVAWAGHPPPAACRHRAGALGHLGGSMPSEGRLALSLQRRQRRRKGRERRTEMALVSRRRCSG